MDAAADNTIIDQTKSGKLTCESCGTEFTCNAGQETCWCFDVKVSPENLTTARENFNNCLCRECLEKINESRSDA